MTQVFVCGDFARAGGRVSRGAAFLTAAGAPASAISPDLRPLATTDLSTVSFVLPEAGGAIVAGNFELPQAYLARVLVDGSNDTTFTPAISGGSVEQVIAHGTGYLLLGTFTSVGGESRNGFARIHADGSVDLDWDHAFANPASAMALHDGGVLVAFGDTTYELMRLDATGAEDLSFTTHEFDARVRAIHVQADDYIVVGGSFTECDTNGVPGIIRFEPDGTADATWVGPTPDAHWGEWPVYSILPTSGTDLYCGLFSAGATRVKKIDSTGASVAWSGSSTDVRAPFTVDPNDGVAAWDIGASNRIRRWDASGAALPGFDTSAPIATGNGSEGNLIVLPDDSVLACGSLTTFGGVAVGGLIHVLADGTLDTDFDPGFSGAVRRVALMADDSLVAVGPFGAVGTSATSLVARVRDGVVDPDYRLNFTLAIAGSPVVNAVAQDETLGRTYLAGFFSTVGRLGEGNTQFRSLARLLPDGSPDPDFEDPGLLSGSNPADVYDVIVEDDGSVVVVGTITAAKGGTYSRSRIAKFNSDGTIVAAFNPPTIGTGFTRRVLKQPDGKYLVAGSFTTFDGVPMAGVLRMNEDGTRDTGWTNPAINVTGSTRQVFDIALQPDGKVLIAGDFTSVGGSASPGVARLNDDGTRDVGFVPSITGAARSVVLAGDGSVFISGGAAVGKMNSDGSAGTWSNPFTSPDVAAELFLRDDGTMLVGGVFERAGQVALARLLATGAVDPTFHVPCFLQDGTTGSVFRLTESEVPALEGRAFDSNFLPFESKTGTFEYRGYGGTPPYRFTVNGRFPDGLAVEQAGATLALAGTFNKPGRFVWEVKITDAAGASVTLSSDTRIASLATPVGALVTRDVGGSTYQLTRYDSEGGGATDLYAFNAIAFATRVRDKSIVVRGGFSTVAGVTRRYIARFDRDGVLDTGFPGLAAGTVQWVTGGLPAYSMPLHSGVDVQSDGRLIVGTTLFNESGAGDRDGRVRRINSDGTNDAGFVLDSDVTLSMVGAITVEDDDSVLIGGRSSSHPIAFRVDPDGALDDAFLAAFPGSYTSAQRFTTSGAQLWSVVAGDNVGQGFLTHDTTGGASIAANCVFAITRGLNGELMIGGGIGRRGTLVSNRVRGLDVVDPAGGFPAAAYDLNLNADSTILDTTMFDSPVVHSIFPITADRYAFLGTFTHLGNVTWRTPSGLMNLRRTANGWALEVSTDDTDGTAHGIVSADRMPDGRFYAITVGFGGFPTRTAVRLFPDGTLDDSFAPINAASSILADDGGRSGFNADGLLGVDVEATAGEPPVPFNADGSLYLLGTMAEESTPVETIAEVLLLAPTLSNLPTVLLRDRVALLGERRALYEGAAAVGDTVAFGDPVEWVLFAVVEDAAVFEADAEAHFTLLGRAIERIVLAGLASNYAEARGLLVDALVLRALSEAVHHGLVADEVTLSDSVTGLYQLFERIVDAAALGDEATGHFTLTVLVEDAAVFGDALNAELELIARLHDTVGFAMSLAIDNGEYIAWAMNTQSKGLSRYTNYPFNSFGRIGGRYIGCAPDGLHWLEGDSDNGEQINALIRTGLDALGTRKLKRVPEAFIGYSSGGTLVLKVIWTDEQTGERAAAFYRLPTRPATSKREGRFKIGRGIKAVDFAFQIENVAGADFELDGIEFRPIVLDRRTRG